MAANVWNYLAGYVIISIESVYCERILNCIIKNNIEIWDISRSSTGVRLSVGIGGFYRLRSIVRQYKCRVRILEKHGLTVFLCHMRGRYVMAFGWVAALILLLTASRYVWMVDIEGCSRVEEESVRAVAASLGALPGVRRGSIDTAVIGEGVMASNESIAWAGAELTGVVLQVSIIEAEERGEVYSQGEPSSMYASCDGIITSVTALSGKPVVKTGDAVKKGQLLINGNLGNGIHTEARGSVTAKVLHRITGFAENQQKLLVESGKTQRCVDITLCGKCIFKSEPVYGEFAEKSVTKSRMMGIIPIVAEERIIAELVEQTVTADEETLMNIAGRLAEEKLYSLISSEAAIISKNTNYQQTDGGITCVIDVITEENIAELGELTPDEPESE